MLDQSFGSNFTYVDNENKMSFFLQQVKKVKVIGIDTEFIRCDTYYPILSLIQVAFHDNFNNKKIFIIDCLKKINIQSFLAIISDQDVIKIFHCALQDLQIFFYKTKQRPAAIIDTQLMANFCGFSTNIGYARLVENLFGKKIDKKLQRSDWYKRPLSQKQLEYATLDVFFLNEIYLQLNTILKKNNRQQFYLEEIEKFIDNVVSDNKKNLLKNFFVSKRNTNLGFLLKNLVLWREEQAKNLNVPRQHFMSDQMLYDLAYTRNLPDYITHKIDQRAIDKLSKIFELDLAEKPPFELMEDNDNLLNSKQKIIYLEAKKIIGKIAANENISEQFLLNSFDLKKIIIDPQKFFENSRQIIGEWRYSLIFIELSKLLKNNL
ncbi:hypothetical protein LBMAG18_05850 [Alphaproteobacteria bacterium]|nr:hypothetical protein LBMAG18_05850 [Alphaproteobacteria bacterium]